MIKLTLYDSKFEKEWNDCLLKTRVDTFLFNRCFMDYHSDRFNDYSFLVYRKSKIEGVIPGNLNGDTWWSHQGLTFGGLALSRNIRSSEVLAVFYALNEYLANVGVKKVIYKASPYIYHHSPNSEDLYCLFRLGAKRIACGLSSCLRLHETPAFTTLRKRMVKKAKNHGLQIEERDDFSEYWIILEENLLKKYNKKPVHSLAEIQMLKEKFPENIKLYCVLQDEKVVGGVVMFNSRRVAHVQYISANDYGKKHGALDYLFSYLINQYQGGYEYFDFGVSTEKNGEYLNEGLLFQKEGFGARGVVYETYSYQL